MKALEAMEAMQAMQAPAAVANLSPEFSTSEDAALQQRRFGGMERLYGVAAAARIRAAHVVVVGIGGVGSWTVEALARSGVGQLTLVDLDHIAESNINRQVHALETTLGQAKVQAMRERIALINPACQVHCIEEFVDADNWLQLVPSDIQGVVDACDQRQAKVAMAAWAVQASVPYVTVGAAGGKRQAHRVDVADLSLVTYDPLLAQLRQQLRKLHGAAREGRPMGITCVFSREAVAPPDASCQIEGDGSLNCHGYGSSVAVTSTFGLCAAGALLENIASSPKTAFG